MPSNKFFARKGGSSPVIPEPPIVVPPDPLEPLAVEGWSRYYNFGAGVDGGGSAPMTPFSDWEEMWSDIASVAASTPKNYLYTGPDINPASYSYRINSKQNKGIYGQGQTIDEAQIRIDPAENIILKNFKMTGAGADDMVRVRYTTGIIIANMHLDAGAYWNGSAWVYPRGETFDITNESDLVTVMSCIIENSDKTHLVSASDLDTADRGKLRITFNGCLFRENTQRTPLIRFGTYDLVNCFITCVNRSGRAQKSIVPSTEAKVIVRGVSFKELRRVCEAPASPGVVGEIWFGDVSRLSIDLSDNVTPSGARVWSYPLLNGNPYDVPVLTPAEAEAYCLSANVGTIPIV